MQHEALTRMILGACFEVGSELGAGFLESVYEKALLIALRERQIHAETQVPLEVRFHGELVGSYFADVFVENKVLVEIKAVHAIAPEHQAQLINYLKATGVEVGLLVNFGAPRVQYKRVYGGTLSPSKTS
jgi:GxxExxY protein